MSKIKSVNIQHIQQDRDAVADRYGIARFEYEFPHAAQWIEKMLDDFPHPAIITPEQQIQNVITAMTGYMGHRSFDGRTQLMRDSLDQLSEMWSKYRAGELKPIHKDEIPF